MRLINKFLPYAFYQLGFVRVWKLIPRSMRKSIVGIVTTTPDIVDWSNRPTNATPPYFLVGLATSSNSFGWAFRATLQYLKTIKIAPAIVDISPYWGTGSGSASLGNIDHSVNVEGAGTTILHINPNQLRFALSIVPPEFVHGKYLIQYCTWELNKIPPEWLELTKIIDEFWVPSRFVKDAFVNSGCKKLIKVIPHKLELPVGIISDREKFGLPENAHIILAALNLRSGLTRKNISGSIKAFIDAFGTNKGNTVLVIKIHDGHLEPKARQKIKNMIRGAQNILLVEDDFSDYEMWSFIKSCDTILSLHRAEGFGLLMLQGILLGKNVVATGWSGNMDFMTEDNSFPVAYSLVPVNDPEGLFPEELGAHWADPDIRHASEILKSLTRGGSNLR